MPQLIIDEALCRGCTLCTKACGSKALYMQHKKAYVNDNCIYCGICLKSCPFGAISMETEEQTGTDITQYHNLWVYVEVNQGEIAPVSLELLGVGRGLAQQKGCEVVAVLLDSQGSQFTQELIAQGADKVLLCQAEGLNLYQEEACAVVMDHLIAQRKPEMVLFGATSHGRSLAPRVAAQAQTGLTADCTILEIDQETGLLRQTRPAFGGNIMATIVCPNRRPQMATVRPGVMEQLPEDTSRTGTVEEIPALQPEEGKIVQVLETSFATKTDSIADAERLVVVGRGIGGKKNMKLVQAFAEKIQAQVAVSRPLVDLGYAEYPLQVGQTGCTVAPKLLISLGVSGAIQHLAGITRAETIIAVNSDDTAPIFGVSHYKVVGDCVAFLSAYLKGQDGL